MNIVLAAVLLGIGFMVGCLQVLILMIHMLLQWENPQVLIQMVEKDSPAYDAGLQFGDIIAAADGQKYTDDEVLIEYIRTNTKSQLHLQFIGEKKCLIQHLYQDTWRIWKIIDELV